MSDQSLSQTGASLDQVQRLVAAADSLACGLDDLCNALNRELDDFQPVYAAVNRAGDALDEYRTKKGWAA